jgi:hypothetical protein
MSDPWHFVGSWSDLPEEEFQAMLNDSNIKEFDGYQFVGKMTDDTDDELFMISPFDDSLCQIKVMRDAFDGDAWVDGYLYGYLQLGGSVYKKVGE